MNDDEVRALEAEKIRYWLKVAARSPMDPWVRGTILEAERIIGRLLEQSNDR